jgi:hypothetical protein
VRSAPSLRCVARESSLVDHSGSTVNALAAVATVLDWYRTGADVPAMMPRLATYLGHSDPKHTFWYLTAAPELMALAGERLDAYLAGRS